MPGKADVSGARYRRFPSTGITGRIFGGFSVVLLLMVGTCGFWWYTLQGYAERVNGALSAQQVAGALQDLILSANRFIASHAPVDDRALRETMEVADRSVARLTGIAASDTTRADRLSRSLDGFSEALRQHIAQQTVKEGLTDSRRRIVADLQAVLVTVAATQQRAVTDYQDRLRAARK